MNSHRIFWATVLSLGMLVLAACGDAAGDTSDSPTESTSNFPAEPTAHSPTEPTSPTVVSCGEDGNSEKCIEIELSCVTAAEALVLDANCDPEPEKMSPPL